MQAKVARVGLEPRTTFTAATTFDGVKGLSGEGTTGRGRKVTKRGCGAKRSTNLANVRNLPDWPPLLLQAHGHSSPWEAPMRHAQSSVFERLSNALHVQFDSIAKEPLPERWVDLINYLNEKEEAQRRAQHWSDRAEEARLEAAGMTDPQARREMLMISAEYRRLADHALERIAHKRPPA
jgi:hypothetical protein